MKCEQYGSEWCKFGARPALSAVFSLVIAGSFFARAACGQASNPTAAPAPQISKQAADLIQQGYEVLSEHDAVGAEHMFRQAIEVQPEVEAAHRGLGLALREEGRLSDAFRELQTATRLDPSDSDAHYTLGSVEWALSLPANVPPGRTRGLTSSDYQNLAAAEFSKALALSPKDPMLRRNLAILYLDSNRPLEALAQAQEGVKIAPQSPDAHVTLGQALFANSEEEKAASEYEAAIQLDPRSGEAYFALGQLRMVQRRTPQAQEAFRHAIQVSPDLGPAYAALAKTLMDEGRNSEARGVVGKGRGVEFRRLAEPVRTCGVAEPGRRDGARHRASPEGSESQSGPTRRARTIGQWAIAPGGHCGCHALWLER